jgi:hypothetical protein
VKTKDPILRRIRAISRALRVTILAGVAMVLATGCLFAQTVYSINIVGLHNGGGASASGDYTFNHTIGQQVQGSVSGGGYNLAIGFWNQVFPPPPPDLSLTVSASPNPVTDSSNLTYSITVNNAGAGVANGVLVNGYIYIPPDWDPWFRSVTTTTSQGSCSNSVSGVVCNLGTLQPGATATITVVGIPDFNQIATVLNIPELQESIDVTNSVTVTSDETDLAPVDNIDVVVVPVLPLRDFGDAPVPTYPTLLPNAARHRLSPLYFGSRIDAELDGLPVDQDDTTGVDDEIPDGIALWPLGYYAGGSTYIAIQVNGPAAYIDMWFDTDGVPGWGAADQVMTAVAHPGGGAAVGYMIALPPGAVVGATWARARVHLIAAGLPPTGYGGPGEVVDFQVDILPAAVDLVVVEPSLPIEVTEDDRVTLSLTASNKGPSTATGTILEVHFPPGATLDALQLSQGSGQMEGTNLVCQLGTLAPNAVATVTFTAGTSNLFEGMINEFYDFCWGVFAVEPEVNPDDNMHHGLVRVYAKRDFGDAPDATIGASYAYPTRLADNGARHRIVGPYFGDSAPGFDRDRDPDGMPTPNADGDDLSDANDDEEGIQFLDPVYPSATGVRVRINAPLGGLVDAWVDFNRNGVWTMGLPEQIFTSFPVMAGTFDYTFDVPPGAVAGSTYARFRISSLGGLAFTGYAPNGEVQDLTVNIQPSYFGGVAHTALGGAALNVGSNGVQVSNLGSNGQDGVSLNLAGPNGDLNASFASLAMDNVSACLQLDLVAGLHAGSKSNIAGVVLERLADSLALSGDFAALGFAGIQIDVVRDGTVVGSATVSSSNVAATITAVGMAGLPGLTQFVFLTDRPDGAVVYALRFGGVAHITLPGLEADGNELRFIGLEPRRRIDSLVRLEVRAANVASFTVLRIARPMPPLGLEMTRRTGQGIIQWSRPDALLEHADSVAGPWNTASNATTGVALDTTAQQKFFRLVQMAARSGLAKMLRRAELVFDGTVTAVEYHDSTPESTNDVAVPHTFVTFAVNNVLKGTYNAATITLRFAGGMNANGRLLRVKDSTLFDTGERSILLVRGNEQFASPLVNWARGRFRLVDGFAYTENGHELVSTQNGRLEFGAWRDLTEVRENDIAGQLLEIIRSADATEEDQPFTPPATEKMSEGAFRQFLLELIQRIHTAEELDNLPAVSTANGAQPFTVPSPGPSRVR